ncbi:MFS transporter [Mesobacillus boroniphilus]|uniref:Macrolide-efflux protein n=1 Tax=Mesobacillus boroniphilus JCM 21738 TaxID=1294265 RepID=W4RQX8_9BACI|nr:macrolide-efflux protein [Mesobacillus boroniphilus JCM 21738]
MLPSLIGMKRIPEVSGYMSSINNTASLIGNSIGGLLLSLIGFIGVMVTHTFIFMFAAILTSWLLLPKWGDEGEKKNVVVNNYWKDFKDGVSVLRNHQVLLILSLVNMGTNIVSIGHLYIVIFKKQYGVTAFQFGLLEATGVAASIITGLLVGKIIKKIKPVHILSFSLIIPGLCMIGLGYSTSLALAFTLIFIQTACGVFYGVVFGTLLITLVKQEYRARVDSLVMSISSFVMPVTVLLGGLLADLISIKYIFYFAGIWVFMMGFLPYMNKEVRNMKDVGTS